MTPLDPQDTFALGVCYYPEHWPRDRWEGYARRMRELGLSYARIAEFAWSRIEPALERWQWDWLDDAIATLADAELKVVLCTPTAAPPAWLVAAHPDILPVDRQGRTRTFGSRRHYDYASAVYRAHSRRVTRAIAGRYGRHPAVVGWQTDNEFGDHDSTSYSPAVRAAFRDWLGERYPDIDALNDAWGNVFWSQEYSDFAQIELPNLTVADPNPSHLLDFSRFCSDLVVRFQEEQVGILRELSPGRWVTHNFMRLTPDFDHYRAAACLDFVSWDSYPTGGVAFSSLPPEQQRTYARVGHPDLVAINHDLYRGLKGARGFWVMEQQAGQINWAPSNPLPADGAVALWTAQAWAHGASVVSYFRWRAATMAQEVMHSGVLRHDETLDRGGAEIARLHDLRGLPNGLAPAPVALLHDYESLWAHDAQPHADGANYWEQFLLFYSAVRGLGVDVDIRHADDDLSGYHLLVAPALQIVGPERARRLIAAAAGARLVVGPRAGYRTPTGRVQEDGQPGPLSELLGCKLLNFDGLPSGLSVQVGPHVAGAWAESYRLITASATTTHAYTSGPLTGQAAVVAHGHATTIGAWSTTLVTEVLETLLRDIALPTQRLPDGVRVTRRAGHAVWQNFNERTVELPDGTVLDAVGYRIDPAPQATAAR